MKNKKKGRFQTPPKCAGSAVSLWEPCSRPSELASSKGWKQNGAGGGISARAGPGPRNNNAKWVKAKDTLTEAS